MSEADSSGKRRKDRNAEEHSEKVGGAVPSERRPTVFLDRDGTINVDTGYVTSPDRIELIPGAAQALGALARGGFRLVIVSNQSAVGRGKATAADVDATNQRLIALLAAEDPDAWPDLILYCPHAPDEQCGCRKPKIGLIESAALEYEPAVSWMFGDKLSDIKFGLQLGLPLEQCILVLTGEGRQSLASVGADLTGLRSAPDLGFGAALVLGQP